MSSQDLRSSPSTWRRVKALGKGGFGTVFLALNPHNNKQFAVKTAKIENATSLVEENKILKHFRNCPEIVQIYSDGTTFEHGIRYYSLFLEYAAGGDLLNLMAKYGGRISEESVLRACTRVILKGLRVIHAKGFVHCDIKPHNILVFPSKHGYRLKISDFGLAKETNEAAWKRKKYKIRGTPAYMSPESVTHCEIESAMDIWSLGCLVVAVFTGKNAWSCYKGLSSSRILSLLACTDAMPEIPKDLSETGKDFLRKCLQRDPSKRWSAQKLLDHPYVSTTTEPVSPRVLDPQKKLIKLPHELFV